MSDKKDVAGVIAFPPLIFGVPLIAGLIADRLLSDERLPKPLQPLSAGFFAAAGALIVPALVEFRKSNTALDPYEETTAILEHGPFAYTRNPVYLALTFAYVGISLAARSRLPLRLLPAVLFVVRTGVIEREERYLKRKFPESYPKYFDRVPRWL